MPLEERKCIGTDPRELLLGVVRRASCKAVGKQWNVLASLAQRRNFDRYDAESEEQIAPKSTGLGFGREISVRRRDDPDVKQHGELGIGIGHPIDDRREAGKFLFPLRG